MDSIEYRNQQVNKEEQNKSDFVVIKKGKNEFFTTTLVVVKLTNEECKEIRLTKELLPKVIETLKDANLIQLKEEVIEVYFCGELNQFTQHEKVVTSFKQRMKDKKEGKDPHYRDYTRTRESQEINMHLVNICRDSRTSWASVSKKLRSEYGILLKLKTT